MLRDNDYEKNETLVNFQVLILNISEKPCCWWTALDLVFHVFNVQYMFIQFWDNDYYVVIELQDLCRIEYSFSFIWDCLHVWQIVTFENDQSNKKDL